MAVQLWASVLAYSGLLCLVRSAAGLLLLPKCCPLGHYLHVEEGKNVCPPKEDDPSLWTLKVYSSTFQLQDLHYNFTWKTLPCPIDDWIIHMKEYYLFADGNILRKGPTYRPTKEYCFGYFFNSTYPIFCAVLQDEPSQEQVFLLGLGYFLSVPFSFVTFLVYAFIKELNTLHGSILLRNMFSFIVACIFNGMTATEIIVPSPGAFELTCGIAGYAIQFFFMATFFWLNVMCFDIYWAFSGLRNLTGSVKERERKKLILYSIYAWCTPLLILIITVAVDLSPSVPANSIFKPQVGVDKCFFREKTATWIYFYLPMALIILSNIFLFTVTAYRIWSHRKEAAVLKRGDSRKHDSTNDKERFSLYLKLFIVMGINWVMELLSSIVGGPGYLWYIPDFTNTLQGVFIFIIFVWKKRVRRLVRAKIYACFGKKKITSDARNGSSTRNTNSTDSSRTNNSIKMTPTTQSFETTVP